MTDRQNDMWICKVKHLLSCGYGVEDIAIKLKCALSDVQAEVRILREMGTLSVMFKNG